MTAQQNNLEIERCETCRAPVVREGDRTQFDSSHFHMDAAKKLSAISLLKGGWLDAIKAIDWFEEQTAEPCEPYPQSERDEDRKWLDDSSAQTRRTTQPADEPALNGQKTTITPAMARRLLDAKAAHIEKDYEEVYHQIYWFAHDLSDYYFQPWKGIEAIASTADDRQALHGPGCSYYKQDWKRQWNTEDCTCGLTAADPGQKS